MTHFESEKPAPRQTERYFSSLFFQWKSIFFSLVSPNALAICLEAAERTTDLSVQTDPVCLPSLPLLPPTLSPIGPQTGLCESHQLHQRPGLGSTNPPSPSPTSIPAQDTFCSHPPHTAPLCALNPPPPQKKPVSFTVWLKLGSRTRTGLTHLS